MVLEFSGCAGGQTHLRLTWILNLSTPGDLTTATYWSFDHYVPDYLPLNKQPFTDFDLRSVSL
ncbi:hypothetical protein AMECASPLE_035140, partial [Ameca splendens]